MIKILIIDFYKKITFKTFLEMGCINEKKLRMVGIDV